MKRGLFMTQEELILKAKEAKSAEEIVAIAKENGLEVCIDDAQKYIELNSKSGEISDEALDGVTGGGAYTVFGGYLIVTNFHECDRWKCDECGGSDFKNTQVGNETGWAIAHKCGGHPNGCGKSCATCKYMDYRFPFQICTHPETRK